jgi:hypothetical protein
MGRCETVVACDGLKADDEERWRSATRGRRTRTKTGDDRTTLHEIHHYSSFIPEPDVFGMQPIRRGTL